MQNMHFRKLHNTGENFLTESGVYRLAFKSHKPQAERFTSWVTDEVLPSIRKTGERVKEVTQKECSQIFKSEEFGCIRAISKDNKIWFVANDVAKALGYTNPSKATNDHCKHSQMMWGNDSLGRKTEFKVITEGDIYRLIARSKLPNAEKFENWVFDEVLPSIRKTGGYVGNERMFVDTYLPFADDTTKLLFSQTLGVIRQQNGLIQKQKEEIHYKQELINCLTDDVDVYTKRMIINRICKRRQGNYANRYRELYKCFRETYHIDLETRCDGYNLKQNKKKDQLTTVAYAEKFGFVDDLYSCCVKLYETEVKEVIDELNRVQ